MPNILAIETSCDDTSVAVLKNGKMLANITMNQDIHSKYGGVVPELASRNHEKNLLLTVKAALHKSNTLLKELDAIAFTQGPGLLGSLLVGASVAKSFSLALNKPLIAVNHLQAHVAALYIDNPKPSFPFLCLLVSGGHTQLIMVNDYFNFEIIGQTLDDAAGEAFDKVGKMLGLPYPAGPLIDKHANEGNKLKFKFTYSKVPNYDYSFSGFKTQVLYFLQKQSALKENFIQDNLDDICASVQEHIVSYLLKHCPDIIEQLNPKAIAVVGGVSANSGLRNAITKLGKQYNLTVMIPKLEYCTDNAAMIAQAAVFKYHKGHFSELTVQAKARIY